MSRLSEISSIPLAERMRPRQIEEVIGQDHLLSPGRLLSKAMKGGRIFSTIFWGPPGSGKTTLARLIGEYSGLSFRKFSAVTSGVRDLREAVKQATKSWECFGKPTILFVDEIHRFNKAQQDGFLAHLESGLLVLIGATTENPSFALIPPLISRTKVLTLAPLGREDVERILREAVRDRERGLGCWDLEIDEDALALLVDVSQGDARVALNNLEAAVYHVAEDSTGPGVHLDSEGVKAVLTKKTLPYDRNGEEHYNLISALHKSVRGSDTQASIYWLYRMLMAGEDPLYIGRRLIRMASEDVGLADPNALQVALSAYEAWEKVGPPEAELALAQAVIYLASAPKSNALYTAEKAVKEEIERTGARAVPIHLRNAPTALMKKMGYGKGYRYPHNYSGARVEQQYLPETGSRIFYRPTNRGFEEVIRKRTGRARERR